MERKKVIKGVKNTCAFLLCFPEKKNQTYQQGEIDGSQNKQN